MNVDHLKNNIQGSCAEQRVDLEVTMQGFYAYRPNIEGAPVDRIIGARNGVHKYCEIKSVCKPTKTTKRTRYYYCVTIGRKGRRGKPSKGFNVDRCIDILAVYLCDIDVVLFYDAKAYAGKKDLYIPFDIDFSKTDLRPFFGLEPLEMVKSRDANNAKSHAPASDTQAFKTEAEKEEKCQKKITPQQAA